MHLRILGHPTCIAHLIQNNRKPRVLKGLNIPIGIMTVFYTTLAPTVLPQLLPGKLLKILNIDQTKILQFFTVCQLCMYICSLILFKSSFNIENKSQTKYIE